MSKTLIVIAAFILMTGCASQGYNLGAEANAEPDHQVSQHFFVSGIGQAKTIDAAALCGGPGNVAKVESQETAANILLGVVTFGIYTPRDAKVYCKKS